MFFIEFNDPKKGEGWQFMNDEDEVWFEAFKTKEKDGKEIVDYEHYGFGNPQEMVNFIAGTGSYDDERGFEPGEEDMEEKKRQMRNDSWKIPSKLEEIDKHLEEGSMRGNIDIDPNAESDWYIHEREANLENKDTKYTASFVAYNPDDEESEKFYFAFSWYDTDPEELEVEEVFDYEVS